MLFFLCSRREISGIELRKAAPSKPLFMERNLLEKVKRIFNLLFTKINDFFKQNLL